MKKEHGRSTKQLQNMILNLDKNIKIPQSYNIAKKNELL